MKPTYSLVNKALLRIDHSYQRETVHPTKIKHMLDNWSWELCGALLVGRRSDNSMWVVDGQQRLEAARNHPKIDTLPCLVFGSEGSVHEAEIFKNRGSIRTRLTTHDIYRARVIAKDPIALTINNLVESRGFTISRTVSSPSAIDCVGTILKYYTGITYTTQSPHVLVALSWAMDISAHKIRIRKSLLEGLIYLAARNVAFLTPELIGKMHKYTETEIYAKIRTMHLIGDGSPARSSAIAIIKMINWQRPRKNWIKLPDDAEEADEPSNGISSTASEAKE